MGYVSSMEFITFTINIRPLIPVGAQNCGDIIQLKIGFILKVKDPFLISSNQRIDPDGVYSGSAFVHHNKIHYFYTGNVKLLDQDYDYINEGREQNTIYFNSEDGYHISSKELLLNNNDYGINMSKGFIRS